jgi:hypothetical protein
LSKRGQHGRTLKEGNNISAVLARLAGDGREWAKQLQRTVARFADVEQIPDKAIRNAVGKSLEQIQAAIIELRKAFKI